MEPTRGVVCFIQHTSREDVSVSLKARIDKGHVTIVQALVTMKPDLECLWTNNISGSSARPGDLYWMKGLRLIERGFMSFWGCLVYLKEPVKNIKQAAFLHGVLTAILK